MRKGGTQGGVQFRALKLVLPTEEKVMRRLATITAASLLVFAGAAAAQSYGGRPPPPPPGYGQTISCASQQYHLQRCRVPRGWRDARIVRQTSDSACVRGRSWGFDRRGVWVDKGCSAVFADGRGGGTAWRPNPGWDHDFVVSCGSPQYNYYFCKVDVGARGRVTLRRQTSSTRCIEGRNWGWNRAGIWVNKGCGAQFTVGRRW